MESLDSGGGGLTLVRVRLEDDTRFGLDKERLSSIDGMTGQRAVVSVDGKTKTVAGRSDGHRGAVHEGQEEVAVSRLTPAIKTQGSLARSIATRVW